MNKGLRASNTAELTLPGDPPIRLWLRRSARSRRISLRISQLDGRVTLTLPAWIPQEDALAFAHEKEAWLRRHLSERAADVAVCLGAQIPIEGQDHEIVRSLEKRIVVRDGCIHVPGPSDQVARRLAGYLKNVARTRLATASDRYATKLGRPYKTLTLRDTRSRWGSCSSNGGLMFSWRLILAPPDVLEYVAAHEVAHLAHMNHSEAFWSEVNRLHGAYNTQRSWLRTHGAGLHRYRFG